MASARIAANAHLEQDASGRCRVKEPDLLLEHRRLWMCRHASAQDAVQRSAVVGSATITAMSCQQI